MKSSEIFYLGLLKQKEAKDAAERQLNSMYKCPKCKMLYMNFQIQSTNFSCCGKGLDFLG